MIGRFGDGHELRPILVAHVFGGQVARRIAADFGVELASAAVSPVPQRVLYLAGLARAAAVDIVAAIVAVLVVQPVQLAVVADVVVPDLSLAAVAANLDRVALVALGIPHGVFVGEIYGAVARTDFVLAVPSLDAHGVSGDGVIVQVCVDADTGVGLAEG